MRAEVDQELCIACGLCTSISQDVFTACANGTIHAISGDIPKNAEDTAREAADSCPTDAIRIEE